METRLSYLNNSGANYSWQPNFEKEANESAALQTACDEFFQNFYSESLVFHWSLLFTSVLDVIICMGATLSNFFVLAVLKRNETFQTSGNILLSTLALSDFLVGFLLAPCTISFKILILKGKFSCNLFIAQKAPLYLPRSGVVFHTDPRYTRSFCCFAFSYVVQNKNCKKVSLRYNSLALGVFVFCNIA